MVAIKRAMLVVAAVVAVAAGIGSAATIGSAASLNMSSRGITPVRTCVLSATPATTTAVGDAEVRQQTANSNFGTGTTMLVTSSGSLNRRIYIMFDLAACAPAIPASATVRAADLRLYVSALPTACRTYDVFGVTAGWAETTVTWANQPLGTTLNQPATASRVGTFDAGTPVGCQNRTTASYTAGVSVTSSVASFVAGTGTNQGWMIRDGTEGSAAAHSATFVTKNAGVLAQVPQLVVTYVLAP